MTKEKQQAALSKRLIISLIVVCIVVLVPLVLYTFRAYQAFNLIDLQNTAIHTNMSSKELINKIGNPDSILDTDYGTVPYQYSRDFYGEKAKIVYRFYAPNYLRSCEVTVENIDAITGESLFNQSLQKIRHNTWTLDAYSEKLRMKEGMFKGHIETGFGHGKKWIDIQYKSGKFVLFIDAGGPFAP